MLQRLGPEITIPIPGLRTEALQHVCSRLRQGIVEQGTVIGPTPEGQTELQIGSRFLSLTLEKELPPGTTFTARMVGGRLVLNLNPSGTQLSLHQQVFDAGAKEPALEVTIRSLVQNLGDLGMEVDAQNLTLARAMVSAGFPLFPALLRELRNRLGELSTSELQALSMAFRKGLPLSPGLLRDLESVLRAEGNLPEALASLLSARSGLPQRGPCGTVREALDALAALVAEPEDADVSAETLRGKVAQFTSTLEAGLAEEKVPTSDLKFLLYSLIRAIENVSGEERGQFPILRTLEQEARQGIDLLTANQLRNLPDQSSPEHLYSVRVPIRLGEEQTELELTVRREKEEQAEGEEAPLEVSVKVRLEAYGTFAGRLSRSASGLYVSLSSERPSGKQRIVGHLEELREALQALGFHSVRVTLGDLPEDEEKADPG